LAKVYKKIELTDNDVMNGVRGGYAWVTDTLTYGYMASDIDENGINDFDEGDWKEFYREIFDDISQVIKLDFKEVSVDKATLEQQLFAGGGGFSGGPGPVEDRVTTAVGIDKADVEADSEIIDFGRFSGVWLHEVGHSLGLKHPHDSVAGPLLPGVEDDQDKGTGFLNSPIYTVMGYTDPFWGEDNIFTSEKDIGARLNADAGTLGAIDIAMLQKMYGARANNTGNTAYTFSDDLASNHGYTTIWDTGGRDTIDYDGTSRAKIDLRAASLKTEIGGGGWLSTSETLTGGFTIANGVKIENAVGGTGDDFLFGNSLGNRLDGGAGADSLKGGGGADRFVFTSTIGEGNVDHIVDFGNGADRILLSFSTFTMLGVTAARFKDLSTGELDRNDRILYDHDTGTLSYDMDGSGKESAVDFAILDNKADLGFSDFPIV
jgi:serralysin